MAYYTSTNQNELIAYVEKVNIDALERIEYTPIEYIE
jgi:hypothetical protein